MQDDCQLLSSVLVACWHHFIHSAELSDTPGLEISSHVLSPIVFLKLKKSTGSPTTDLDLLETIAERVLKEDSVFIVTSKKSNLDRCKLPIGIRLFVSAGHTESDISALSSSLKRVSASVLSDHFWSKPDSLEDEMGPFLHDVYSRPCGFGKCT